MIIAFSRRNLPIFCRWEIPKWKWKRSCGSCSMVTHVNFKLLRFLFNSSLLSLLLFYLQQYPWERRITNIICNIKHKDYHWSCDTRNMMWIFDLLIPHRSSLFKLMAISPPQSSIHDISTVNERGHKERHKNWSKMSVDI